MADEARRKHARSFLTKGLEKKQPSREEFTAYGQACISMAVGILGLLRNHGAVLFAAAIPRDVVKPTAFEAEEYLRKDHVFLLERFFYLLEERKKYGILVFDEHDKTEDSRFVRRLQRYYSKTAKGRYRTAWIVPTPFFVSSDMTYAVQAADLCMYCINWGFRLPSLGMNAEVRPEIAEVFGPYLNQIQYRGQGYSAGATFDVFGIVYVPDPYTSRAGRRKKEEATPLGPPESRPKAEPP